MEIVVFTEKLNYRNAVLRELLWGLAAMHLLLDKFHIRTIDIKVMNYKDENMGSL